jgi:hypothetical protein
MEGSLNHGRLYYRCAASRDYVRQHNISHPPMLYLREDAIADAVDRFLHEELGERTLSTTLRRLADAQHRQAQAEHHADTAAEELRRTIDDCDTQINRYRAALDAGGDPPLIAEWIRETTAMRKTAQARLGLASGTPTRMSEAQIQTIVEALGGLLGLLRNAEPSDRAEIYTRVGLQMTYQPGSETVLAQVTSKSFDGVVYVCPRSNTRDIHTVIASREMACGT